MMFFHQQSLEGLGCFSYMIGCDQTGACAVIDPQRDIANYLEIAAANGLIITHVIETHVHADHVSGGCELAAQTGATICIHERAGASFAHQPLRDGDRIMLGECRLDVLFTPGHTPDSICLLVTDTARGDRSECLLAGDTLFVGDVGRPDLVQGQAAAEMAALLYASLHEKLLSLPDDLRVYPGHGAGSLCGRSLAAEPYTTIGQERCSNPALLAPSRDEFIACVISDLPARPANLRRIKALNTQGPPMLGCGPRLRPIDPREAARLLQQGHVLLDIRGLMEFSWGHVRGAVNISLADRQFCSRAGQRLAPDVPIILMADDTPDTLFDDLPNVEKAGLALASIGYDRVAGYLEDGLSGWQCSNLPLASIALQHASPQDIAGLLAAPGAGKPQLVDVREPWEWSQGHLPGAIHIPLYQLERRAHEVDPGRPVVAYCRAGSRSQSAAAILAQLGHRSVYNLAGGIESWRQAGYALTTQH